MKLIRIACFLTLGLFYLGRAEALPGAAAYYAFDEASGAIANDSSGNGNTATITGATRISGIKGDAMSFAAANDKVQAPNSATLTISGSMTLEAWIKPASLSTAPHPIILKGATWPSNYSLSLEGSRLLWKWGGGSKYYYSNAVVQAGVWQHVALSYDSTSKAVRFYVNGVAQGTDVESLAPTPVAGPLYIGSSEDGNRFLGAIDEVRIYKRALSADEVNADKNEAASAPFDFSLSTGGAKSVAAGRSVSNMITAALASGTSQSVSFSATGLPAGVTASFSAPACTPGCSSTLNLQSTGTTPAGTYTIMVAAAGGGVRHVASFALAVTAAADTQAPSVPAGLTVGALSSSQIALSWQASSDNVGVAGYKIYRNGVQLALSTGTAYQDIGLDANTSYSYAVAAYDAAGNTSGLSPVSTVTTPAATSGAAVTSFTLVSPTTQSLAPFTLGHAFRRGDIPAGASVLASVPHFQASVKTRWSDGSVQYAILAGRADLQANVPFTIELKAGNATVAGTALTEQDLRNAGANAQIAFQGIGTVELSGLIGQSGSYDSNRNQWSPGKVLDWVSGPEFASWVYAAPLGSDPSLSAWYEVRLWQGGRVEVLPWIENGYLMKPGAAEKTGMVSVAISGVSRFGMNLNVLHHTRAVLASGAALSHWLGSDPAVTFKHDVSYLQKTKLVPTYIAHTPPDAMPFSYLASSYTPFGQAGFPLGMGSAGYDPSIGLLPEWDVLYLTSNGDPRALKAIAINGYAAGRYGLHYRDEKTNRPPAFTSYPNLVVNDSNSGISGSGASTAGAYTPPASGAAPPLWASSHAPSIGYMAYLLYGRFYFMEEAQFAAAVEFLKQTNSVRQFSKGILESSAGSNTTRGAAWGLRMYAQAAIATPDDDSLKLELSKAINENIDYYHSRYVAMPNNPQGIAKPYSDYTTDGDGVWMTASWMEDFLTAAFGYVIDLDLPATAKKAKAGEFFNWKARSIIGRLGNGGPDEFDYRDAAPYTLAVAPSDNANWDSGSGPWYSNWGQIYRATLGANAGTAVGNNLRGAYFPEASSYWGNLQPAISYAVTLGVPGAAQAYARMTGAANWPDFLASANSKPVWSVGPAATPMPVVDSQAPSVTMTAPLAGQMLAGSVGVSANASDNVGVAGVQFKLDGVNLGAEILSPPYTLSWDTRSAFNGAHVLTAVARDAAGNRTVSATLNVTVSNVTNTLPGSWSQIPNSKLQTLCPPNGFGGTDYPFSSYCPFVVTAWNSAVMDTKRNRLIVWGGGHMDYHGNEVYAVDLTGKTIARLTDPGLPLTTSGPCQESIVNGSQPNSRHTYAGIEYLPNLDRMFVFGGALSPCGFGGNGTWMFDFASNAWEQKNPSGDIPRAVDSLSAVSAYDPNTGKVFLHDNIYLYSYDPFADRYTRLSGWDAAGYYTTAVIDPVRKKFVMVGYGAVNVYDIGPGSTYTMQTLPTIGGSAVVSASSPGLAYDPASGQIVAWSGGNTVYSLDLDNGVWAPHAASGNAPGPAVPAGTFGHFRYSPASKAFVLINSMQEDIYLLSQ